MIGKKILENDLTIAYARVSSHDQKEDLQAETLANYCTRQGWNFQVVQDSGMNYQKKSLKTLMILEKKIGRLEQKDKEEIAYFLKHGKQK